jgi:hypothetical protein
MDLLRLTKGYFDKDINGRTRVVNTITADVLLTMLTRDIDINNVIEEIDGIITHAESLEDYETVEVLLLVKNQLTNDGL